MVAIRELDVTTGESRFITPPVDDKRLPELEQEAERHTHCEECNGRVYFVVHLACD
jgi:hypothetical protein